MTKIVEVPGMGNVEFPDEMDDNQISDAIHSQMAQQTSQQEPSPSPAVAGGVATSGTPTTGPGLTDVAKGAVKAVTNAGAQPAIAAAKEYFSHPVSNLGVDIAAHMMGSPVYPMATKAGLPYVKTVLDKYKEATNFSKPYTAAMDQALVESSPFMKGLTDKEHQEVLKQLDKGNYSTFELPEHFADDVEAQAFKQKVRDLAPSIAQRLGTSMEPILNTASRAARGLGYAGMAYDTAKNLFYTSPEEIATLKAAEAQRRAQGWQPANLSQGKLWSSMPQSAPPTNPQPQAPQAQQPAGAPMVAPNGQQQMRPQPQQQPPIQQQPPTSQNFIARVTDLANRYLPARQHLNGQ
jgi:hypothetical protein